MGERRPASRARFIEPMRLLRKDALPDDPSRWTYELKLDGYRAVAFSSRGGVHLRSRNDNDFSLRYRAITRALAMLPDETTIDGEIVAVDEAGRPSFNLLQNHGSSTAPIFYYVFDVMMIAGRDVTRVPLDARRALLEQRIAPLLREPIRYAAPLDAALPALVASVKAYGFEGLVAKSRTSPYEPGLRSGAWLKMRLNRREDFVIGGYTIGRTTFDALILGHYESGALVYVARTRNGFTPASRARLMKLFGPLEVRECPFSNLPETRSGRWGQGLTAEKMAECRWLRPVLVGQVEFLEWTADDHLRHSKFVGVREDRVAADVTRP